MTPSVQPLSYRHRNLFFFLLLLVFIASLPFLFLYATGYRFNLDNNTFVSTGGIYIGVERTGAQIFIDNELVRETRVFRRAFYSQGLEAKTHRIHVQKDDHHTWVKELPVYPHLVTEAQAFNLPLIPEVRIISKWQTTANVPVILATTTTLTKAKINQQYLFLPDANTKTLSTSTEFSILFDEFSDTAKTTIELENSTTTKVTTNVHLYEKQDGIYVIYKGKSEQMPYYYCAETFPPYIPDSPKRDVLDTLSDYSLQASALAFEEDELPLEVQTINENKSCHPEIKIDTKGEAVNYFDFFPNNNDLIITSTQSGIYVTEIDPRAWQNRQPLLTGEGLTFRIVAGAIYIYDGELIYQVILNTSWF